MSPIRATGPFKDVDLLARCFSKNAEDEFQSIAQHRASTDMLEDMSSSFGKGTILESEQTDDLGKVIVHIRFTKGDRQAEQQLTTVKEDNEWKILEFIQTPGSPISN